MMRTRLRGAVLVGVLLTIGIALWKKLLISPEGERFQVQATPPVVTAQEVVSPETTTGKKMPDTTAPKEWQSLTAEEVRSEEKKLASFMGGRHDPDLVYKKYLLASYLYKKHESIEALPLAISYATQLGRFDEASALLKELPDLTKIKETLEVPVLMKLLMNTSDLSFAQLKQLKDFIETLKKQGTIGQDEYSFYYFILTLIKGDMGNAQFYLSGMEIGTYRSYYVQLHSLEQATTAYASTPPYYLRAVWAMYLYQQGRWGPAQYIGQQIRQEDPSYLLAEQLIAYSSMALKDWKGASLSFQQLQLIDPGYTDVYKFFQAITHYEMNQYEVSILLFEQVPATSVYYFDVIRYMFLAYVALGDEVHIGEYLDNLLAKKTLEEADVYTIFDAFLYSNQQQKAYTRYHRFSSTIETVVQRCQTQMQQAAYICLYGKGGVLLASGEKEKAYKVISRIINRYPRASLYVLLGELAEELGYADDAEKRFHHAFLAKQDQMDVGLGEGMQVSLQ